MISPVLLLLTVLFIIFISGLRVSKLLLPEKYREYYIFLAPFLGIGIIELAAQNFSVLGIPCKISAWIILSAILSIECFFLYKNKFLFNVRYKTPREEFYAFLPGLFSALILIAPIILAGYLTCFGGGTDSTGYIRYAYFLQNSPIDHAKQIPDAAYPWYGWVHASMRNDFLGSSFLLSILSSILFIEPLKLFNIVMASYGFLVPTAVYVVLRMCLGQSRKISLLSAFLMACQNFWLIPGYTSFLNQMSAIPYFVLLFGMIYMSFEENDNRLYVLSGFLTAILISHYSVVLALLLPILMFYALLQIFKHKMDYLKSVMRGLVLMFCLPVLLLQTISYFTYTSSASYKIPNIFHPWISEKQPLNFSGLLNQYLARGQNVSTLHVGASLAPFLNSDNASQEMPKYWSGFFNLDRTYKPWLSRSSLERGTYRFFQILFLLLVIGSVFIIDRRFRFFYAFSLVIFTFFLLYPMITEYWYGLWKIMTFVQFLSVIGICFSLDSFWNYAKKFPKIRLAFAFLLVYFSIHNVVKAMELIHRPFYLCDKKILELEKKQKLLNLRQDEGVQISFTEPDMSDYDGLLIAYMFKESKLIIPEGSPAVRWFFFSDYKSQSLKPRFYLKKINDRYEMLEMDHLALK